MCADRAARRTWRRDAGFGLLALVGYTKAGKSTIARRLADEVAAPGESPGGDRPFETLSTTTHRATVGGRRTAITDTVGFPDGVPHEAIRSFRATLDAVRAADCGLLVVDATDAPAELRRKLRASLTAIGETEGPLVPTLSKADRLDADGLAAAADAYESAVDGLDERETRRHKMRPAMSNEFWTENDDLVEQIIDWRIESDASEQAIAWQAAAVAEFDVADRLGEIRVPTLVVHGTDDRVVPVENGRLLADGLSNAEYHELDGAPHLCFIERADTVNDLLRGFLDDV